MEIGINADNLLIPRAEYFFNESDSAPAFYNASDYGHNNRQGYAGQLDYVHKSKHSFKIGGRFVNADLINQNSEQSKQQFFMIRFETLYDYL